MAAEQPVALQARHGQPGLCPDHVVQQIAGLADGRRGAVGGRRPIIDALRMALHACRRGYQDPGSILVWSRFSCGGGGLIMQYSWPGPIPPGGRRGTIRLIRCARCGGPLYYTKSKGQPRQEDHEQGCEAFTGAIRVMRYVDELKRSASESAAVWGRTWRRRYLRENAKKLSVAACESDPVAAISALGDLYQAECQTPGSRVRLSEKTELAETLMRACRQLALGQDPAPITSRPW